VFGGFEFSPQFGGRALGTVTTRIGFFDLQPRGFASLGEPVFRPLLGFVEFVGVRSSKGFQFVFVLLGRPGGVALECLEVLSKDGELGLQSLGSLPCAVGCLFGVGTGLCRFAGDSFSGCLGLAGSDGPLFGLGDLAGRFCSRPRQGLGDRFGVGQGTDGVLDSGVEEDLRGN
jgi:hypothetical protein